MGFFSGKSKTYVSSSVYNMAGDEAKRPNFLKTTVLGTVMAHTPSFGANIVNAYLRGPGLRFRTFAKWARDSGYTAAVGQTSNSLNAGSHIDDGTVIDHIPDEGMTVHLQSAKIGNADYEYWADKYILENIPEAVLDEYKADYDPATNVITLDVPIGGDVTFTPEDFDINARYLYAGYRLGAGESAGPLTEGALVVLGSSDNFPSTVGWANEYNNSTPSSINLAKTVTVLVTYSDGRPNETTVTPSVTPTTYNQIEAQWEKITYKGNLKSDRLVMTRWTIGGKTDTTSSNTVNETIAGGVIKTTKTTTDGEVLSLVRTYQIDQQEITNSSMSDVKIFIYKYGSGQPALDAMFADQSTLGAFLPYIPVRIDNKYVTEYPDEYARAKKAYKKAMDSKFDKLIDLVDDNPSIKDIDFAYVCFGVCLNVRENACKKYIFRFIETLLDDANLSNVTDYLEWAADWEAADLLQQGWNDWRMAQDDESNPLYGAPEPAFIPYPTMPVNSMQIASGNNPALNYNMTLHWNYIQESSGAGLAKLGAKVDELWLTPGDTEVRTERILYGADLEGGGIVSAIQHRTEKMTITWQTSANTWRRFVLAGFKHQNLVYGGKSVDVTALEALADADDSGFIIPLHEGIYRDMGMKDMTQMATACSFIVFNTYQVVKQKWYQTGIFKIIVIIIIIIVSIFFPPAGGAGAGILGSAAEVGASLGFTGAAAVAVGVAVNAIAGMILMTIIQAGAKALFGDKLGGIIGAVLAVVAVAMGTSMANGTSMAESWGSLMQADNILKLTVAAGNGYAEYLNAGTNEIIGQTTQLLEEYKTEAKEITDQFFQMFGMEGGVLDPSAMSSATKTFDMYIEPVNSFLGRTLMTGSDVADLSFKLISEFSTLTLTPQLAIE